ncbi:hypothetical protein KPA97_24260, partial [Burkholderia cenocepacia]|nr:hypothetical protein [Burkholderia cenocepacia]
MPRSSARRSNPSRGSAPRTLRMRASISRSSSNMRDTSKCSGLVGLKPTRGVLSTLGVVPACRSLDCVSVFARSADDARVVFAAAHGVTEGDPYGRAWQPLLGADGLRAQPARPLGQVRFGTPRADQLEFFGDASYRAAWGAALERLRATGAR